MVDAPWLSPGGFPPGLLFFGVFILKNQAFVHHQKVEEFTDCKFKKGRERERGKNYM